MSRVEWVSNQTTTALTFPISNFQISIEQEMSAGESRQELLAWLNDLLQLNYTKIEQVGTGAALCQIFDSIYGASRRLFKFIHPNSMQATSNWPK